MTDISWSMGRIVEAIERTECRIQEFLANALGPPSNRRELEELRRQVEGLLESGVDERQAFVDRAAVAFHASGQFRLNESFEHAEKLWTERQRRRGQPQERELVVRYLNSLGTPEYRAAADAIKAGKHTERDPNVVTYPLSVLDELKDDTRG